MLKWFNNVDVGKDLVLLIPIFTGSTEAGHFTALICDRTYFEDGIFVFMDSFPGESVATQVESTIKKIPELWKKDSIFIRVTCRSNRQLVRKSKSPREMVTQAMSSNDCGVFTCLNFYSYLRFLDHVDAWNPAKRGSLSLDAAMKLAIQVEENGTPKGLGLSGRSLIEKSFSQGCIDPGHSANRYKLAVIGYR